jgi:RND family efflux transporter MFP subunit
MSDNKSEKSERMNDEEKGFTASGGIGAEPVKPKRKLRRLLLPLLLVIVVAACGTGFYVFGQGNSYFSTDNAKVTAKMYAVYPVEAGELLEWNVTLGDEVQKNQILGRQNVLPYITAPIRGLVVKNDAAEGQNVTPSAPIAVIADTAALYIGVNIEETDIIGIAVGQMADVRIDAYKGKVFRGIVGEIDQATQTYFTNSMSLSTSGTYTKVTQLVPVKIYIENTENLPLAFGMNATVKIHLSGREASGTRLVTTLAAAQPKQGQELTYSSNVEAGQALKISPDISGKIASIEVNMGQKVQKGDVLLRLDATDAALQARQAEAGYRAAQVAYESSRDMLQDRSSLIPAQVAFEEAQKNYERMQTLFNEGAVSQLELDSAGARLETADAQRKSAQIQAESTSDATQAQMNSAKAALDIAMQRLEYCTVKAPMDGEVLEVAAHVGDMVSAQSAPVTLIDAREILLKVDVTESRVGQITAGMPAEIRLLGSGYSISGAVSHVAPGLNPSTGMFSVELRADNADGAAEAGMAAEIRLQYGKEPDYFTVPARALHEEDGAKFVYVARPDGSAEGSGLRAKVEKCPVTAQTGQDGAAVVERGLRLGDRVILESTGALREGMEVSCIDVEG